MTSRTTPPTTKRGEIWTQLKKPNCDIINVRLKQKTSLRSFWEIRPLSQLKTVFELSLEFIYFSDARKIPYFRLLVVWIVKGREHTNERENQLRRGNVTRA